MKIRYKTIFLIIFLLGVLSCNEQSSQESSKEVKIDTIVKKDTNQYFCFYGETIKDTAYCFLCSELGISKSEFIELGGRDDYKSTDTSFALLKKLGFFNPEFGYNVDSLDKEYTSKSFRTYTLNQDGTYFIIEAMGFGWSGSGGTTIRVYHHIKSKYKLINDLYGELIGFVKKIAIRNVMIFLCML